jgi:hypothetical protein
MSLDMWWHKDASVLFSLYNGIIADDCNINDMIILNKEDLNLFINSIALNIINPKNESEFVTNRLDMLLNNNYVINFKEQLCIIITSAEIDSILYSELYESYVVILKNKRKEKKAYSLGVVRKKNRFINKFFIMNEKPEAIVNNIEMVNNNDEY